MRNPSVPAGFWRGVNTNHNAIYVDTFIDQLANEVGEDPLAFRLKYLKPKHAAVLKAVADKAGYGTPAPKGVYRGISQIMGFGSYVAGCAEVSVTNGNLKIHRIVGGTNSGHAVNPEQIARQVEGSFVYGLSAMLYGECTVRGGHIEQKNFDTYQVMRIDEMPKVEAIVMPDGEFWGGGGGWPPPRGGGGWWGGGGGSRPSRWRRPPCSTPSRRRPASASATSRSR